MAEENVKVYVSSVSSNREMKRMQAKICDILSSKKITFDVVDISANEEDKSRMREGCGDPTALPPRIFKGGQYIGDFEAFDEAIETDSLLQFLQIES